MSDDDPSVDWPGLRAGFPPPPRRAAADGLERYVGRVCSPASPPRGVMREFVVDVWDVDGEQAGTAVLTTADTTFAPHLPVPGALVHVFAWEADGKVRKHALVTNPHLDDVARAELRAFLASRPDLVSSTIQPVRAGGGDAMFERYEMKLSYPAKMSLAEAVEKAVGLLDFKAGDWEPGFGPVTADGMAEATISIELEQDAMRNRPELFIQDCVEVDGDFEIIVEMK